MTTTTLKGKFTITLSGVTKVISFSKGNLQYNHSDDEFRFANNQYDYIGDAVSGNVYDSNVKSDNTKIGDTTYEGWIDLFGWGTGYNPFEKSNDFTEYKYFNEWGYNKISGEYKNWNTLTYEEWYYLLFTRNPRPTYGTISVDNNPLNDVRGYFLIPDNWVQPQGVSIDTTLYNKDMTGHIWDVITYSEWKVNHYNLTEWQKLENSGVVFLPISGYRKPLKVSYVVSESIDKNGNPDYMLPTWCGTNEFRGQYWSSSESFNSKESVASYVLFSPDKIKMCDYARFEGYAVRLVRDINDTAITIDTKIVDNTGKPLVLYHTSKMDEGLISGTSIYTVDKSYAEKGAQEQAVSLYVISKKPYGINLDEKIWSDTPEKTTLSPYIRVRWIGYKECPSGVDNSLEHAIETLGEDVVYGSVKGWLWSMQETYPNDDVCRQSGCQEATSNSNEDLYLYRDLDGEYTAPFRLEESGRECCYDYNDTYEGTYSFEMSDNTLTLDYGDGYTDTVKIELLKDTTKPLEEQKPNDIMWQYTYDGVFNYNLAFRNLCVALSINATDITKGLNGDTQNSLLYLLPNETFLNALVNSDYDSLVGDRTDENNVKHKCVFLPNNKKTMIIE